MAEWMKLLLTGVLTLVASTGFWNYKIKKLERKHHLEDKSEELIEKVDALLVDNDKIMKKLDALTEAHKKTNEVTMAVARDRIFYLANKWKTENNYEDDNMRDLISLFEPYKANGGNGLANEYFEKYEYLYKTKHNIK